MFEFSDLSRNPFFQSGIVLMLLGGLFFQLKRLPRILYDYFERIFVLRLEILDEDEAFEWTRVWLADRLRDNLSVSVVTKRQPPRYEEGSLVFAPAKPRVVFVPAVGVYFFWYRGRLVSLSRERFERPSSTLTYSTHGDATNSLRDKERFTLRIFSRDRGIAHSLIEECRDFALPDDGRINVFVAKHHFWHLGCRLNGRPLSSVILDGGGAQEILDDVVRFLSSQDWYQKIGVPYRRGYLLYGPPGNGKTSIVKAIAGELKMNIYVLVLSDPNMNDQRLQELMSLVPEKSLMLLEDIDCAFAGRKQQNGRGNGLTFSGLLNAMDGVASTEGRITMMTTNHREKLDDALLRPGRVDVKIQLGNATSDQARQLFERFFPGESQLAEDFAGQIEDGKFSMATLQDYLMLHRADRTEAVSRAFEIGCLQSRHANAPVRTRRHDRIGPSLVASRQDSPVGRFQGEEESP